MQLTEAELRDRIAENVALLEEGLQLLNKEQYIPNSLGTRSFVDLYARDSRGHHVLIELKRSDAAAREAIHEVHKYVEGVKRHLGARDAEIRVIVASTEWRELVVPFSRFVADTELDVLGLHLTVDPLSGQVTASHAALLPVTQGRFIAPWHDVNWYESEEALAAGITSIEASCAAKRVEDFVIVVLRPAQPASSDHQAMMWSVIRGLGQADEDELNSSPVLPTYEFIAYFAQQLTEEQCWLILEREPDVLAEARETTDGMSEEERLHHLYEEIACLDPRPLCDHLEIGYPAKFSKFMDSLNCTVEVIHRYGVFRRNTLLQDEAILSELRGEDGSTGQRFKRTVSVASRAHMASAKTDLENCLAENPAWKAHVLRALGEVEREYPSAELDISVFNPATGLLTLYYSTTREDGFLYVPTYHIVVRDPDPVRMYYGVLQPNGSPLSSQRILQTYYDGDLTGLLMTMTWGGHESRDADIVEDMGLAYRSFRCDILDADRRFFALREERWRPCDAVMPIGPFYDYIAENEASVRQLVFKISQHDRGGIVDLSSVDLILDELADLDRGRQLGQHFAGAPENCDVCGCTLAEQKYMADTKVPGGGDAWGCMCGDCFVLSGGRFGWGLGQLYIREDEEWLLVAGFPPEEGMH
ncbi:endonuclease NucS domain-containing protein [Ralstonia sp. Ralssp110]|uniref:endonuclease NucS domain-containing protein n=1 Tax=Ralstonia sp. Ralssp110 TaxID=3243004 RepID=UPI0039B4DB79